MTNKEKSIKIGMISIGLGQLSNSIKFAEENKWSERVPSLVEKFGELTKELLEIEKP